MITEYLENHSLNADYVKSLGWIWEDDSTTITIPIYNEEGKLLFSRYRHLEGSAKFTTDKGAKPALYCVHKIKNHNEVVLCEGESDTARLWQEGIPAVTGTSGVKTFSRALASPLAGKTVKICLDNDEAGNSSVEKYYSVLSEVGADPYIVELPEGVKDVCEFFTLGGTKQEFAELPTITIDDWKDKNTPEEFRLETVADINEYNIPPEEWLVNRILPAEGFAFIVGAEATGKSFYTLTLAQAVATGEAWLKNTAVDDTGKPLFYVSGKQNVLIIDKENTKRRVQSRTRWLGMGEIDNIYYLKYPHYFELADPREDDGISKIAKEAARQVKKNNIKFIIIDSFTDVMVGNENAAGDVQGFFDAMRRLFPNVCILVLHHASKPAQGVVRTSAQRARGSTNIMAQVYSAFYVEALPKSRSEFVIEQTKAGDAEKFPKFYVELDVQRIEGSDKTKVAGINYKGIVPDEEMKTDAAFVAIEGILVAKGSIGRKELLDMLQAEGISKRTALRAIKQMTEDKKIESVPDEHNKSKRKYIWISTMDEDFYSNQADLLDL